MVSIYQSGDMLRLTEYSSRLGRGVRRKCVAHTEAELLARRNYVRQRSLRTFQELYYANQWSFFVTLTVSPATAAAHGLTRSDHRSVYALLAASLKALRLKESFSYLLTYDYHVDGSIHLHGFFNISKAVLRRCGTVKVGSRAVPAYYCPLLNRLLGRNQFSVLVPGKSKRAVSYVLKYVTKAFDEVSTHAFFCSVGLKRYTFVMKSLDVSDGFLDDVAALCGLHVHHAPYSDCIRLVSKRSDSVLRRALTLIASAFLLAPSSVSRSPVQLSFL